MSCPVCERESPTYPVADMVSGWTFCNDCYHVVKLNMPNEPVDSFGAFLRAIAEQREARAKCLAPQEYAGSLIGESLPRTAAGDMGPRLDHLADDEPPDQGLFGDY